MRMTPSRLASMRRRTDLMLIFQRCATSGRVIKMGICCLLIGAVRLSGRNNAMRRSPDLSFLPSKQASKSNHSCKIARAEERWGRWFVDFLRWALVFEVGHSCPPRDSRMRASESAKGRINIYLKYQQAVEHPTLRLFYRCFGSLWIALNEVGDFGRAPARI